MTATTTIQRPRNALPGVSRLGERVLDVLRRGPADEVEVIDRIAAADGWRPPRDLIRGLLRTLAQLEHISGERWDGRWQWRLRQPASSA